MIRLALLSFWHVHAKDYARQAAEHPEVEIAALWDEDAERGRREAEARGIPFFENLPELLDREDIDGVVVDAPTAMHRDVMVAAAQAGKHIFTEKVLAPTSRECGEIVDAVEKAGVKLTVSLPRMNTPFAQAIRQAIAEGVLGELTLVRIRLAHKGALSEDGLPPYFYDPEQTGGGAMIDLGCHPMYLARLLLGMPESVSASFGSVTGRAVEDNAVAVLRYGNGALGMVEAGFVSRFSPLVIEAHGTEGSLWFNAQDGKVIVASTRLGEPVIREWKQPSPLPSSFEQWISHIQNGTTARENIDLAVDLTRLMEAAYRSASSKRAYDLNEIGS
ncbi:Gfo/Idh/MocA family protein [Paenibacillus macerans]|uniref:Gfo/Idh/MocA family protein n=1 Tax=Paenibacillus macerans TaxID=44252 RepID=UPI003D322B2C